MRGDSLTQTLIPVGDEHSLGRLRGCDALARRRRDDSSSLVRRELEFIATISL